MKVSVKLSASMEHVLRNLAKGLPANHGLVGMSQHGGLNGTVWALKQRELIDDQLALTPKGASWIEDHP